MKNNNLCIHLKRLHVLHVFTDLSIEQCVFIIYKKDAHTSGEIRSGKVKVSIMGNIFLKTLNTYLSVKMRYVL